MTDVLSIEQLTKQKAIFEETLVKEILAEIRFIEDGMGGRAQPRPGFAQKVINYTAKMTSAILNISGAVATLSAPLLPGIGTGLNIAAVVVDTGESVVQSVIERHKGKQAEKVGYLSFSDVKHALETCLRQFAKVAFMRYEYLIGVKLSEEPAESVIPLARIGARRVVEFLCRHLDANTSVVDFSDVSFLLDGLIQGRSGSYRDGFKNNRLVGRNRKSNYTVEGAYRRSAIRVTTDSANNIYYRGTEYTKSETYTWDKTKLDENGPKYGYILVDEVTRDRYGFHRRFKSEISQAEAYRYQSRIYLASEDEVFEYIKQFEETPQLSFLAFIQKNHPHISEVWVKDKAFDEKIFKGDFTDVDFSGCSFSGVTFDQVTLTKASLALVTLVECTFKGGDVNHADFSFASLQAVSFQEGVSTKGAKWLGAYLKDVKDDLAQQAKAIEDIQEKQEKMAEDIIEHFSTVYQELRDLEEKQVEQFKVLEKEMDEQNLKNFALINQLELNTKAYQAYYEQEIVQLKQTSYQHEEKINSLNKEVTNMKNKVEEYQKNRETITKTVTSSMMKDVKTEEGAKIDYSGRKTNLVNLSPNQPELLNRMMGILETQNIKVEALGMEKVTAAKNSSIDASNESVQAFHIEGNDNQAAEGTPVFDYEEALGSIFNDLPKEKFTVKQEDKLNELLNEEEKVTKKTLEAIMRKEGSLEQEQKRYLRKQLEQSKKQAQVSRAKISPQTSSVVVTGVTTFQPQAQASNSQVSHSTQGSMLLVEENKGEIQGKKL